MCPHGKNSTPTTCSQCIGAPAKRCAISNGESLVEGVVQPKPRGVFTKQQQRMAKARANRHHGHSEALDAITEDVAHAVAHLPPGEVIAVHAETCPRYEGKRLRCSCSSFVMRTGAKA